MVYILGMIITYVQNWFANTTHDTVVLYGIANTRNDENSLLQQAMRSHVL